MKLHKWPSETTSAHFRGVFWLGKNTFRLIQAVVLPRVRIYIQTILPLPRFPFTCIPFAPIIRPTRRACICSILIHQNDNFAELFARFEVLVCQTAFGQRKGTIDYRFEAARGY